ncbi:MAG: hypothetical protein ACLTYN_09665 [Dysosmobacter welbionis]
MRAQLTRMAAALRALYDSMGRAAPVSTEENPAVVFDRAAEKVCRAAPCASSVGRRSTPAPSTP